MTVGEKIVCRPRRSRRSVIRTVIVHQHCAAPVVHPEHKTVEFIAGTLAFEIAGISDEDAKHALHQAGYKLSVKSRVIKKGEVLR